MGAIHAMQSVDSPFWSGRRVLVTGGAGFIGSHLTKRLVAAGASVRVADSLERGRKENLADIYGQIDFRQLDLASLDNCLAATAGMDVVMNLAARACGLEYSQTHHGEMLTYNTLLGLNVLEASRQNHVERVLVVSTSCVYPDEAVVPIREDAYTGVPERVNEGYALGKMAAEQQARYYAREYGMKIAIARPNNAYGAGDIWDGEKSHVIPALIKRVLDGEDPVVAWGSGQQSRAFVHVDDITRAFMLLTEHYACADPVNVGHERETSIADLLRLICQMTGRSPELRFDRSKPEGAPRKSLSAEKLRRVTGYEPDTPLDQGLKAMVAWYTTHFALATSPSPPLLTIITPVYCEDELITATVTEVKEKVRVPYEMLVVYDFDEDTSIPYVKALMPAVPELKLVRNNLGRGVINAIRAGIQQARGRYVVIINGDLADDAATVNDMVRKAEGGYGLVCGTRYSQGGRKQGGPFIQDLLSRLGNWSFHVLSRFPTRDATNSFKLYRHDFLQATPIESKGGFDFSMELAVKARRAGLRICEVPTVWRQRKSGESRFRLWTWLSSYLRWYVAGLRDAWTGNRERPNPAAT